MRPLLRRLRYAGTSFVNWLAPIPVPRREEPVHLTVQFHCESIAVASVFEPFLEFVTWLAHQTDSRPTACVTTPLCPKSQTQMREHGVTEEQYVDRVAQLAEVADIGYHGHFYVPGQPELTRMASDTFDEEVASEQMEQELAWLRGRHEGVTAYCGGWWAMNEAIARLLDEHGMEVDCSLRRTHESPFGERYMTDDEMPSRGVPFLLPPTDGVVEIQSGFYPIDHPRRALELLLPTLLFEPDAPLFVVLPSHEGEALESGKSFRDCVRMMTKLGDGVRWTSLREQARLAREAWGLGA